ncbi:reverse transcriptase domain-containing protein [Enterococcus rotai]|uniref:reverse transcriptase domain-containing protein n=1 Tax=Enterococcus rotai TaxID=118060 RepID=UPI0032B4875D
MKVSYKYPSKPYLHFDKITSFNRKVEKYVYDFEENPMHSFLPLIFSEITMEKFKDIKNDINNENKIRNGKKVPVKEKIRPIMYASHIDNYIYKHYGVQLNTLFNSYITKYGFDNSVTAYRTNKDGKNNIYFAAEIINYISENPMCYVYVGDYTGFFDNLNHDYLKDMINLLYEKKRMPDHQFKIFKSLTKYSYVHKKDINYYVGEDSDLYKKRQTSYFSSFREFREFKNQKSIHYDDGDKTIRVNDKKNIGIPQGTAISAIYSNIYMLQIDEYITKTVEGLGGIYRRYSDDFIMVLPNLDRKIFDKLCDDIEKKILLTAKLEIHPEKTSIMIFDGAHLKKLDSGKYAKLDYLGFVFDGKNVRMREKSIYKFYRTAYKLIRKGEIISKKKGHVGERTRLTYKRKLYQNYHHLGEHTDFKYKYKKRKFGTFITYARKSQKIFEELSPMTNNLMTGQIKNHQKNIRQKMNKSIRQLKLKS